MFQVKSALWNERVETRVKVGVKDRIISRFFEPVLPDFVLPNHITVFRFISVPFVAFFLFNDYYGIGFILFAVSAWSDALDGAIARTRGQVTDWGKLFDPVADKLLIGVSGLILFSRFLSVTPFIIAVSIEILLVLSAYYKKKIKSEIVEARGVGKVKMVLQSLSVGAISLYAFWPLPILLTIAPIFLYISIFFALVSLVVYRSI
jgi:CDP-diacylglycerol--glycerol-3-phosphate 3-phosphatidyltransferase